VLAVDEIYANAAGDAPGVVSDLGRGRVYVEGIANETHVPVFRTVEDAIDEILRRRCSPAWLLQVSTYNACRIYRIITHLGLWWLASFMQHFRC